MNSDQLQCTCLYVAQFVLRIFFFSKGQTYEISINIIRGGYKIEKSLFSRDYGILGN